MNERNWVTSKSCGRRIRVRSEERIKKIFWGKLGKIHVAKRESNGRIMYMLDLDEPVRYAISGGLATTAFMVGAPNVPKPTLIIGDSASIEFIDNDNRQESNEGS